MLLLFDIDGTLLLTASGEHREALHDGVREVYGVDVPDEYVATAGRTDRAIARSILELAGLDGARIDQDADAWCAASCRAFARRCPPELRGAVAPGAVAALEELRAAGHELSLVTGNLEPIARLKLDRAGLGSFFPAGQGGFGSDREDRGALPDLARERAGGRPRAAAAVVGDTPLDIACARADGVRCIAITTGPYTAAELREADAIVDHLGEVGGALARLNGSSPVRADHGIA
ncbi:MAG: phosphoglycolate phosphatase [Solirubrobacteraceae bacterium]|nr:phosphoglycolate phosphatase [Solirubrobacteraceae bacterium]